MCEYCPSGVPSASTLEILMSGIVSLPRSIRIVRIAAERVGAEYVSRLHRRHLAHIGLVELLQADAAHQAEVAAHLVLEQFEHAHDARPARGGQRIAIQPSDADRRGAECNGFQHVGSPIESAVNEDRYLAL